MDSKILLKLGGRKHLGEERWKGALSLYDEVYCACLFTETDWDIRNEHIHIIKIPKRNLTSKCIGIINRCKDKPQFSWLNRLALAGIRFLNRDWMQKVGSIEADSVLCSYGDYDKSDFVYAIAKPVIHAPVVRAYKESRVGYNFLELNALKSADKIVLYDVELKRFLEKKYGESLFEGKKVLLGYDENSLPGCILNNIRYREKYSSADGKVHLVILSFRVDSAPNRSRDESRYYYVDIIRDFIEAGIVVHLHCAQYNDFNGINRYKELQEEHPGMFYMEKALSMKHSSSSEEWIESCEILSRYDIGLLHNIQDNSSVSEFDRINIPHRFFAYETAHVAPITAKGNNVVLERLFAEKHCGFVYDKLTDLQAVLKENVEYYTPSYEDYLKAIFKLED